MGINQLRLVGNGTDLESQLKNELPGIELGIPGLLGLHHICWERVRERERKGRKRDMQTDRHIHIERLR